MKYARTLTLAFLAGLIEQPASAQTTDCVWTPTGYSCETAAPPASGFSALANALAARDRKRASEKQENKAEWQASFDQSLANMIREGKCAEAKDFALINGQLDAAEQSMRICRSPQP